MKNIIENGILTVFFEGRIDAQNAPTVSAEINGLIKENPDKNMIIDAEDLIYLSSAGLRVVLSVKKEKPDMKMINVSPDVYDILEMTGFTEMITVEKAYRKVSVDGCEVIGVGANGTVYRLDPETIIKVYKNHDALPDIQKERMLARHAFVLGIPTAISYDVVKIGEYYGSVFELLNAKSVTKLIIENPGNIDEYIVLYTRLLKEIHSKETKEDIIPDAKQKMLKKIEYIKDFIPADKWLKLYGMTASVPDDNHLIHGDYHTKNVMVEDGKALLIDMDTLSKGNPIFEMTAIYNAYVGYNLLDSEMSMKFQGYPQKTAHYIWNKFIRLYYGTDDEKFIEKKEKQIALLAFASLYRRAVKHGQSEEEQKYYREELLKLIDSVDSLK